MAAPILAVALTKIRGGVFSIRTCTGVGGIGGCMVHWVRSKSVEVLSLRSRATVVARRVGPCILRRSGGTRGSVVIIPWVALRGKRAVSIITGRVQLVKGHSVTLDERTESDAVCAEPFIIVKHFACIKGVQATTDKARTLLTSIGFPLDVVNSGFELEVGVSMGLCGCMDVIKGCVHGRARRERTGGGVWGGVSGIIGVEDVHG